MVIYNNIKFRPFRVSTSKKESACERNFSGSAKPQSFWILRRKKTSAVCKFLYFFRNKPQKRQSFIRKHLFPLKYKSKRTHVKIIQ